jgi:L-rhamnose-H+ transport protein
MDTGFAMGVACVVLGGAVQGAYAVPLKYLTVWKRENTWAVYSLIGMLLLPWITALTASKGLEPGFRAVDPPSLLLVCFFGLCWGIGNILYGLGVLQLGVSLGAAIILGVTTVVGSLVPLLAAETAVGSARPMLLTFAGVAVMMFGVVLCAMAGHRREGTARDKIRPDAPGFLKGLTICLLSGALSAFLNFGFISGRGIVSQFRASGNSEVTATFPALALLLSGGFVGNLLHSAWMLRKNRSWGAFTVKGSARQWVLASLMAFMLFGGYVLYGAGVSQMGSPGPSVGWALFICMFIITANAAGMLTGEWNTAGNSSRLLMVAGSGILLIAVLILAASNSV